MIFLIALPTTEAEALITPAYAADSAQGTVPSNVSVIQRIRDRDNTLVAGVQYDFPPYEFIGDDGQVTGFHVALIRAMAAKWEIDVEFVPVTPSDRLQKLQAGFVDIVPLEESSISLAADGDVLAISHFYLQDQIGFLVQNTEGASFQGIGALDGKSVAIVTGSGVDKVLNSENQSKSKPALLTGGSIDLIQLPFREYRPALSAVRAGQVDAALGPKRFLDYASDQYPQLATAELTAEDARKEAVAQEQFALGFSRGDPYFRGLVDFTLQQLWVDGTLPALSSRWLGDDGDRDLISAHVGQWPYTFADSPIVQNDGEGEATASSGGTTNRGAINRGMTGVETILERQRLIVGIPYDLSPIGFVSADGEVLGLSADIARSLAARWLGDSNAVELVPVTAQTRLPFLATGAVDLIIAPTTPTWYDETTVDFSTPFLWDNQSLLVQSTVLLQNFEDLEGQNIAIISGSRASTLISAQAEELGIQIALLPFQEYSSAFQSLRAKQVVAVAGPSTALKWAATEDDTLRTVDLGLAIEPYSIALPDGDDNLRTLVNAALQEIEAEGILDTLYQKWFGNTFVVASQGSTNSASINLDSTAETATQKPASVVANPTQEPTLDPTPEFTKQPIEQPTSTPRPIPTSTPTSRPTATQRPASTRQQTPSQSATANVVATAIPTVASSELPPTPTRVPTQIPTQAPTEPPQIHTVQAGDSLTSIATEYYGQQSFFQLIYDTNSELIGDNPNFLVVGTRLVIPSAP